MSGAGEPQTCSLLTVCSHRWNTKTKTWEIAPDVLWGADGMRAHQNPRVPRRYSTVDTGGFFYGIYRLFHWW